jgi:chromosome segregation ATPase
MPDSEKILGWRFIFLLGIVVALVVVFPRTPKPCQEPLTYRLGHIDERFGLTRREFSVAVKRAAAIWGKPLSRELFREDSQGAIEINLVYDYRQEASDKLKKLNYKIDYTKDSYENMKLSFQSLKSEYEQKRAVLDNDLDAYNSRVNAYNAEIESWNRQSGAPENVRNRLMSGKNELNSVRESLQIRQDEAKRLVDEINSMALVINEIAANLNLDLVHYRDVGSQLGSEFEEGFFESKKGKQSITVYHFYNDARLVRVLVHELGHALRLNHTTNPNTVMYRLNQSDAAELTADDIASLKARCEGS